MNLEEWLQIVKIFVFRVDTPQRSFSAEEPFSNHVDKMTYTVQIIQFLQLPCAYTMDSSKKIP